MAATQRIPPETFGLERIRLRRSRLADAEAIFAYGSDPEVARYADWPLRTNLDALFESLRQRSEPWATGTDFSWVITLHAEVIGTVSCALTPHAAEYGFLLNRHYWGQGYATEASRAIVDWALSVPEIYRVWASCDTENLASLRVLEKSGLSREGLLRRAIVRPNLSKVPRDAFIYAKVR